MAHVLIVGPGMTNYRLPADADPEQVKTEIKSAFQEGSALEIPVQLDDNPLKAVTLILNGRAAPSVAVAEIDRGPEAESAVDLSQLEI